MIEFIPPGLSIWAALGLIALSFAASLLTAAVGIGGGILLLAGFANLLPAAAIVPVHALAQLGSNSGRAVMLRQSIDYRYFWPFLAGTIVGIALGASIYVNLPLDIIRLILGLFVLQTVWLPLPFIQKIGGTGVMVAGTIGAFLTMFVGATGVFVASIWQAIGLEKRPKVATHAAAMILQHGIKVGAFALLGFAFQPWLAWIAALIAAGVAGTYLGSRILERTPDVRFHKLFKWVLTALALSIVWQAVSGLSTGSSGDDVGMPLSLQKSDSIA